MNGPHVLITRPVERADPLAVRIGVLGWTPLQAPVLRTELTGQFVPPLKRFDAIVFTSATGVRTFRQLCPDREHPAYAVGQTTAGEARAIGFRNVITAGGDLAALNALLANEPVKSVLYVSGEHVSGEVRIPNGTVERVSLYRTVAETALPTAVRAALYARTVAAVCFLSQRTARTFISLVDPALLTGVRAVALSQQIADAASSVQWARIDIAASPTVDALVERLGPRG